LTLDAAAVQPQHIETRIMRIRLALLLASLVTLPVLAGEITTASVLSAMNAYRAQAGLPPLSEDARLDDAAGDRMKDMEELGYWAHQAPDGRSPFMWLRLRRYDYRAAGENLAAGFETAELLVQSWMESEGHRANIMSSTFADCGIAIIDGSTKGPATGRSVVVMFGRTAGDEPPRSASAAITPPAEPGRNRVPRL
jgi:uncharacterized protein YkwD